MKKKSLMNTIHKGVLMFIESQTPSHYVIFDGKYQVKDLVKDRVLSLSRSNYRPVNPIVYCNYADAIEYLMRWHNKGGIEDLRKAKHTIELMIKEIVETDKLQDEYRRLP